MASKAPEFTSDRLRLLGSLVTPQAIAAALQRLADGEKLLDKIALILVREINPMEHLSNEEEGVLRGLDRKTVGKMKAAKEL